ncbi:MAG: HmuY family protein [Bacteroidetes bacterium]|nr:HmuY family protein [Bacteroidota bacterium]
MITKQLNTGSLLLVGLLSTALILSGCNQSDDPTPLEAFLIGNLPADPPTGFNPTTGAPTGTTGKFTLFSFATGEPVSNSDSLTNKWDIGFRATTIIVNGGKDRKGNGGIQILTGTSFDQVKEAPESGYATDDGSNLAVPSSWYNYNATAKIVTPLAGNVFVIRTGTGKYAKMEILSYYLDAPASPTSANPSRYYTFKYAYQSSGSRKFE